MKNFLAITLLIFVSATAVIAQQFDLRFNLTSIDCETRVACYDVQIQSTDGTAFNLAGQNYRIYYDNSLADWTSGTSVLPSADYTDFNLVQDVGPSDASSFSSNLGFEATIGFLNYFMDLNDVENGGILIPANGDWVTTSNLCFTVDQSVIDDPNQCIELVWAKDGKTNALATAFNEVSQWVSTNNLDDVNPIGGNSHDDLDSSDGEGACFTEACAVNPVEISIGNGVVTEDNPGTQCVTVTLSEASSEVVSVDYSFADGTADNGSDFTASNGTLNIPAGQTSGTICFNVIDDSEVESTESFTINISSTDGNVIDSSSTVQIGDNDVACSAQAPVISGN